MKRSSPHPVSLTPYGLHGFISYHDEAFEMDWDRHDFGKWLWVSSGYTYGDFEGLPSQRLNRGDQMYIPSGVKHRFRDEATKPCTIAMICFREDQLHAMDVALLETMTDALWQAGPCHFEDPFRFGKIEREFRRLLIEQNGRAAHSRIMLWSLFLQMVIFGLRQVSSQAHGVIRSGKMDTRQKVRGLCHHLSQNFDQDFHQDELARKCGMSVRTLCKVFKEETGRTILEFMHDHRIRFAKERILETKKIAFSAYEAGYQDLSSFYRMFKRREGMTPKSYLNEALKVTP